MFSARLGPVSERARYHVPRSPQVYAEMPYALEIDDQTVRTRENALMMSLEIEGIEGITASDRDILDLSTRFAAILDGLDDRFSFSIHRLMRPAAFGLTPIYGEGFAHDVETAWRSHLSGQHLREFMLVLTVIRHKRKPLRMSLLAKTASRLLEMTSRSSPRRSVVFRSRSRAAVFAKSGIRSGLRLCLITVSTSMNSRRCRPERWLRQAVSTSWAKPSP